MRCLDFILQLIVQIAKIKFEKLPSLLHAMVGSFVLAASETVIDKRPDRESVHLSIVKAQFADLLLDRDKAADPLKTARGASSHRTLQIQGHRLLHEEFEPEGIIQIDLIFHMKYRH